MSSRYYSLLLVAALFISVCLSNSAYAAIHYVPEDFATIQEALDGALGGDTIIVRDGIWTGEGNKDLDFNGKALTLRSENGAANCIIDCEEEGRGFIFTSGATADATIDGITITNGKEEDGGAIYCSDSSLAIMNCVITNNSAYYCQPWGVCYGNGGGIYCMDSSMTISNCTISRNSAGLGGIPGPGEGHGGGIRCGNSSLIITDSVISENGADHGGGISCGFSTVSITGCTITGNVSAGYMWGGGGIDCSSTTVIVSNSTISKNSGSSGGGLYIRGGSEAGRSRVFNCMIEGNGAEGREEGLGGGIFALGADSPNSIEIDGCTIIGNFAVDAGGGIFGGCHTTITNCTITANLSRSGGGVYSGSESMFYDDCSRSNPTIITNCIITNNHADERGGGIHCGGASTISNCTISGNMAFSYGGGIISVDESTVIANSILWGNTAIFGPEIAVLGPEFAVLSHLSIGYCDIQGTLAGIYVDPVATLIQGPGNIAADPLFVGEGDYHLAHGSPCIDVGANVGIHADIDGDARPQGAGFDIGADEYIVPPGLSRINCTAPANESLISSAPTFMWTPNGGTNNVFVVDMALSVSGPWVLFPAFWESSWTMPQALWDFIPSGSYVYWRVRGADLDQIPLTIIYSDELWWFYKL